MTTFRIFLSSLLYSYWRVSGVLCREAYVGLGGGYFGIDSVRLPYYLDVGMKEYIASKTSIMARSRLCPKVCSAFG